MPNEAGEVGQGIPPGPSRIEKMWQQVTDLLQNRGRDPKKVRIADLTQEVAHEGAQVITEKKKTTEGS